ncbi:MAG: hypothetical protein ACKVZJ_06100 [Phycisphaerales bacterium]
MKQDPILAEIRRIRDAFAKKHGYSIARMAEALRAESEKRENTAKERAAVKPTASSKPRSTRRKAA